MDYQMIAEVAHEVNKACCEFHGDDTQLPWDEAPDWQRDSSIAGVKFVIENPNATAEDVHDSWVQTKLDAGWFWGPVKDADKKEHPCIVGYDSLPDEQKLKDHLYRAVVTTMAEFID